MNLESTIEPHQPASNQDSECLEGGLRSGGRQKQSLPGQPLITVITVVYNGERYLEEALLSVLGQTYGNVEYLLVDGGSTDRTLDILRKYNKDVDYWISEKDENLFDAINKGIRLAGGDILGILNSDDLLYPDALENVAGYFQDDPELDYTYGPVDRIDERGEVIGRKHPLPSDRMELRKHDQIPFPHMSLYAARRCYERVGLYDPSYKFGADYDFVLRLLEEDLKGVRVDKPVGQFRSGGKSDGIRTFLDARRLHKKYGVPVLKREWSFITSVAKFLAYSLLPIRISGFLKRFRKGSVNELH